MTQGLRGAVAGLVLLAAGCGSTSSGAHSSSAATAPPPKPVAPAAELKASGEQLAADLEASRFASACEGFTTAAVAKLAHIPGGCAGALQLVHSAGGVGGKALAHLFRHALATRLPQMAVSGDEALYKGIVEARYERGRWRFEAQSSLAPST
jgi:hypothetical protein